MQHHSPLAQRKWKQNVCAIASFYIQYTLLLMELPKDKEKAHWNDLKVSKLIDYLYENRSEVGEGGNFSADTYSGSKNRPNVWLF